jgi:alanine-glyoxylate transaminase/serine-glyoxylate transaminase/serine-pyruvate transaminase
MAVNLVRALHTALEMVLAEGLEARFKRHEKIAAAFRKGITALGLEPVGREECASPTIGVFYVPEGYSDRDILTFVREKHGIQIGGGLGQLSGRTVRVGHMGPGANLDKIVPVLDALQDWLNQEGLLNGRAHGISAN